MEAVSLVSAHQRECNLTLEKSKLTPRTFHGRTLRISEKFKPAIQLARTQYEDYFKDKKYMKEVNPPHLDVAVLEDWQVLAKIAGGISENTIGDFSYSEKYGRDGIIDTIENNCNYKNFDSNETKKFVNSICLGLNDVKSNLYLLQSMAIIDLIFHYFPPDTSLYVLVGRSPTPIGVALQLLTGSELVCHLPFTNVSYGLRVHRDKGGEYQYPRENELYDILEKLIPVCKFENKSLLFIDYVSEGKSVLTAQKLFIDFAKQRQHKVTSIYSLGISSSDWKSDNKYGYGKLEADSPLYDHFLLLHDDNLSELVLGMQYGEFQKNAVCPKECELLNVDR